MPTANAAPPPATSTLARRLLPIADRASGTLVVHEVYRSLQGEGTFAGLPCVFVRLAACNLRCTYCDTPHAFHSGRETTIDDLLAEAIALGDQLVEITGGEPLLQAEVFPLITQLADRGKTVLVETGGSIDTAQVDPRARIILDVKTPGSGEEAANFWPNLDRIKPIDEVKFVVCDRADFDWSLGIIREHNLVERCPVLMAPVFGRVEPVELASWILESEQAIRLQVQLHKLIWGADTRGV